jgi:hypothetical protein
MDENKIRKADPNSLGSQPDGPIDMRLTDGGGNGVTGTEGFDTHVGAGGGIERVPHQLKQVDRDPLDETEA